MERTYRFRFLFYLAALVLIMSACLAYAGEPRDSSRLLLRGTAQHSGFLGYQGDEPSFDPAALRTSISPAVSAQTVRRVMQQAGPRHGLTHRAHRLPLQLGPIQQQNESSVLPAAGTEGKSTSRQ